MTTSERVNTAAGRSPALTKTRWSGRTSVAPAAQADHGAVAHERGIERDRDVVGRHDRADMRGNMRIARRQRLCQRADA